MFTPAERRALVLSTLAGLSTTIGAILAVIARPTDRVLAVLLGLATGVMLTLSILEMWIHNAVEHGWTVTTACVALGVGLFRVLHPLLPSEAAGWVSEGAGKISGGSDDEDDGPRTGETSRGGSVKGGDAGVGGSTNRALGPLSAAADKGGAALVRREGRAAGSGDGSEAAPSGGEEQDPAGRREPRGRARGVGVGDAGDAVSSAGTGGGDVGGPVLPSEDGAGSGAGSAAGAAGVPYLGGPSHPPHGVAGFAGKAPAQRGATVAEPPPLPARDVGAPLSLPPPRPNPRRSRDLLRLGLLMAGTMTLHNLPEGLGVALSSYAELGPLMAVAIAVHNIPEGMIVAGPMFAATGSRTKALAVATLSGLSEPLGAALATLTVGRHLTEARIHGALATVGGIMVAACIMELVPEGFRCAAPRHLAAGTAVGTALMAWTLWVGA